MLAIRVLQEQGVEVEALNFQTLFTCCKSQAAQAARELGVRLTVLSTDASYLDVIRRPQHGYGRGANPCIDCRIYMFRAAARYMAETGADLVISGEVVGQRPMSQKKRDLALIARQAGLEDRLLRPLSAWLLPRTLVERRGQIDRQRLYGFSGRSRKGLIELARHFGFSRVPHPSSGCALTHPAMAAKVFDLVQLESEARRWDFELLKIGRHVRYSPAVKVVLGRRAEENQSLERLFERADAPAPTLLEPADFDGPTALLIGPADADTLEFATGLILRFGRPAEAMAPHVQMRRGQETRLLEARSHAAAMAAAPL
jgi:hypothetical protein